MTKTYSLPGYLHRHFPMEISEANPTLQTLSDFASIASEHGAKVLFFVWPLDQEYLGALGVLNRTARESSKNLATQLLQPRQGSREESARHVAYWPLATHSTGIR